MMGIISQHKKLSIIIAVLAVVAGVLVFVYNRRAAPKPRPQPVIDTNPGQQNPNDVEVEQPDQ